MSPIARKTVAIIALVAMAIFVVTLTFVLGFSKFYPAVMGSTALISGFAGIMLWLLLKIDDKRKQNREEISKNIDKALKEGEEKADFKEESQESSEISSSKTDNQADKQAQEKVDED